MKQIIMIVCIGFVLVFANSCKEDVSGPIENDGVAPAPVTNPVVENLNGAAEISFDIPRDPDLLYVRAVYTTRDGQVRETKASRHHNSIMVVGFGDTNPYEVSLYSVDKGDNASVPVSVIVNPKTPIMKLVRDQLVVASDFGGINIGYSNEKIADLAIVTLANDDLGKFLPLSTYNTNLKSGKYSIRNLKADDTRFGIFVRDRWGNLSDTLYLNLTPLFESKLDRTKMKALVLPTDAGLGYGGSASAAFDGNLGDGQFYHTNDAAKMPQWFTFDTGVQAKISRVVYYMKQFRLFDQHAPREVEIWGTNQPSPDGSFTNWVLLTTYKQIKPSGLPNGQLSQADKDAGLAGESIPIPVDAPKVRYLRFKTLRNWIDGTYVQFNELEVYGDIR